MKTHLARRIPLAVAAALALAVLALGFPASASPAAPNPGHAWTELEDHGIDGSGHWLGTTSAQALELRVNSERALRLEPHAVSPNLVGGFSANAVNSGAVGATVGGGGESGSTNRVTDNFGTIGGGRNNQAGDDAGTTADANFATVAGGRDNTASAWYSTVGGGWGNEAAAEYATICGGGRSDPLDPATGNGVTDDYGAVGGGGNNQAGDAAGTATDAWYATVSGGRDNTASGDHSTIGGGWLNTANGGLATVGGGQNNTASAFFATVGGGENNAAGDQWATVSGGNGNGASAWGASVGGGENNSASGLWASVPGGQLNAAQGDYSFAAGHQAKVSAAHDGSSLFADDSGFDFNSAAADEFAVRSTGGSRFVLGIDGSGNPTWTCSVSNGGTWSCSSARALKENLALADGRDILERLSEVPLFTWNAKGQEPSVRHLGPMAEDFHAAFSVGDDDGRLSTIDLDGVALAAIQGLYELVQEKDAEIAALEQRLDGMERGVGGSSAASQSSPSGLPSTWLLLSALLLGALATGLSGLVLVQQRVAGGRR